MKPFFLAIAFFALSVQAYEGPSTETLLAARISREAITIRVRSGGCTWKNSFHVRKQYDSTLKTTKLTFIRLQPDLCEGFFPEGRVLNYNRLELQIKADEAFTIGNPFAPSAERD